MSSRQAAWDRLGPEVDLLVVGGGITGAGVARDAARRGLRTALVEMRDIAWGTSSRSSKLVHGGLRYLEQYEFSLVFEAVSERRILLDIAPHLVDPLAFLFPVYQDSRHKLWFVNAGMWVYEGLSLFRSPKRHRTLRPDEVAAEEPALDRRHLTGAPLYYDCSTDDARLTLETALDAASAGATVVNWARVDAFLEEDGRVVGARVVDAFSGEAREVRAAAVVNATGPWTDRTLQLAPAPPPEPLLRPTKGVHVVVDRAKLPVRHAVVCTHPADGRVLFVVPWGDRTYLGTTDTDFDGDPADVAATAEDVDYLLTAAKRYFPLHAVGRGDVISTWAGLRPLIRPPTRDGVEESAVSREHRIVVGRDGLVTVAGGKLTTHRRMAAEVVDTVTKLLRLTERLPADLGPANTDLEPLPGAVGWPEDDDHEAVARQIVEASGGALDLETGRYFAGTYGMRGLDVARRAASDPALAARLVPGRPERLAQVDHAVEVEMAATVSDVLVRRTQLFHRDVDQGLGAAPLVADRMASRLGWSPERRRAELEAYQAEVATSRRWRQE